MRLLQIEDDGSLSLVQHISNQIPQYAILSHTWGPPDEEVIYQDLVNRIGKTKLGYKKIAFCQEQARQDGLKFFWVDTCCIDKTSSTELAEAINSMFQWYKNATKCYVYMPDVLFKRAKMGVIETEDGVDEIEDETDNGQPWLSDLKKSRWFTRGWTLQELIAPKSVEFFSREGYRLGDKHELVQILHDVTGIAAMALKGRPLARFSIDERMSWAKGRQTTKEEDEAYCLLGIFDVQIPLLYGELREKAFDRLRREIKQYHVLELPKAEGASFASYGREHGVTCLENTRTELLDRINDWAKDSSGKTIFWLSGMAGTGKSTIARTIAQTLDSQDRLGASFFFKKGESERGNASRLVSTIATDLVTHVQEMRGGVKRALEDDSTICSKALSLQFDKLILDPLKDIDNRKSNGLPSIVLIDALDECQEDRDIKAILQFLSRTAELQEASLRFLVTSRPELVIRHEFKEMPDGSYQDLILHEVADPVIEHDLRIYFEYEFMQMRKQRMVSADWPKHDQILALVDLAKPLFIFATTVCRYIDGKGGSPEKRLKQVLAYRKSSYSKLDQTYLPVLNQLLAEQEHDDKEEWLDDFREIVGGVVLLESPLSIASLASLLDISRSDIFSLLDSLRSVLDVPSRLNGPVRLLHLSFREFLVKPREAEKHAFMVNEADIHEKLLIHSLKLMSGKNGLRQDMCNLMNPGILKSNIEEDTITGSLSPELRYACLYWVHHLTKSRQRVKDKDQVEQFLRKHFLHWVEAMSLLSETGRCIDLLIELNGCIDASAEFISSFVQDAELFMRRFRELVQVAPLQVYYSAMSFAPTSSIIRKTFIKRIPQHVEILSDEETDWDLCHSSVETQKFHGTAEVAFSPDSQLFATCCSDAQLWKTATGEHFNTLKPNNAKSLFLCMAFCPTEPLIAFGLDTGDIEVWNTSTWTYELTLRDHSEAVSCIAFVPNLSPNGQLLVSGAYGCNNLKLWNVTQGTCCVTFDLDYSPVRHVIFSPNGQRMLSSSEDGTSRLWDIGSATCLLTFRQKASHVIAFSPESRLVGLISGTWVADPTHTAASNETVNQPLTLSIWDIENGSQCVTLLNSPKDHRGAVFSPSGNILAFKAENANAIYLWDAKRGSCQQTIKCQSYVARMAFSLDDKFFVCGFHGGLVQTWAVRQESSAVTMLQEANSVDSVYPAPDGRFAIVKTTTEARIWDMAEQKYISAFLDVHLSTFNPIFSSDSRLLASVWPSNSIRMWNTTDWTHRTLPRHAERIMAIEFSLDGAILGSSSGSCVRLWQTSTGQCVDILNCPARTITKISISKDCRYVACTELLGRFVWLWNVAEKSFEEVRRHNDLLINLTFSTDTQFLAIASTYDVRLWDLSRKAFHEIRLRQADVIQHLYFSSDSSLFAFATFKGSLQVWETATGHCCYKLETTRGKIGHLTFLPSRDGENLRSNRGVFPIPLHKTELQPSCSRKAPLGFVKDEWVYLEQDPILWIPPIYRTQKLLVSGTMINSWTDSIQPAVWRILVDNVRISPP